MGFGGLNTDVLSVFESQSSFFKRFAKLSQPARLLKFEKTLDLTEAERRRVVRTARYEKKAVFNSPFSIEVAFVARAVKMPIREDLPP